MTAPEGGAAPSGPAITTDPVATTGRATTPGRRATGGPGRGRTGGTGRVPGGTGGAGGGDVSRWRASPARLVRLVAGLWLFGTGDAFLLAASLGNAPWTVLAEGVAGRTPLSIGVATQVIGALVLLGWVPLRERPGLGTLLNVVLIGVAIDVMLPLLPTGLPVAARGAQVLVGIAVVGLGSGLYLTARLGPGPRDGWMTGLCRRYDLPVWRVRTAIEAAVLALGWLLGGTVGLGTVAYALLIGPAVDVALRLLGAPRRARAAQAGPVPRR